MKMSGSAPDTRGVELESPSKFGLLEQEPSNVWRPELELLALAPQPKGRLFRHLIEKGTFFLLNTDR